MNKIKIVGLLNLKDLFIFKNYAANFENAVNAAYKLSEDGAAGVVIYGKLFSVRKKIFLHLKDRLDIPVSPFITSKVQIAGMKSKFLFSAFGAEGTKKVTVPGSIDSLKEKYSPGILITNKNILKLFRSSPDYLDEITAMVACKSEKLGYEYLITENVLSAVKGAEVCGRLF